MRLFAFVFVTPRQRISRQQAAGRETEATAAGGEAAATGFTYERKFAAEFFAKSAHVTKRSPLHKGQRGV